MKKAKIGKRHNRKMKAAHKGGQVAVLEMLQLPITYSCNGDPEQLVARLTHQVVFHLLQFSSPLGVVLGLRHY